MIDSSEQNSKNNAAKGYVIFTQFILEVLVFSGSAIFLGLYLDKLLNTKCLFLIIFIMTFSFVPIYNLIKRVGIKYDGKLDGKKKQ